MEKELKRLKTLVDEEQTELLVEELQEAVQSKGISEEELEVMKQEIYKIESEIREAKKFKITNKD